MSHPNLEELLLAQEAGKEQSEARLHLAEGCARCAQRLERAQSVLVSLSSAPLPEERSRVYHPRPRPRRRSRSLAPWRRRPLCEATRTPQHRAWGSASRRRLVQPPQHVPPPQQHVPFGADAAGADAMAAKESSTLLGNTLTNRSIRYFNHYKTRFNFNSIGY